MDAQVNHGTDFSARPLVGKVLVVGMGKTGLSCARFLQGKGHAVALTDSRPTPPGLAEVQSQWPDLPLFVGGFERRAFAAADSLVVSPGVALTEPLVAEAIAAGKPVLGDIELFAREVRAPVAAITGSNGKSTVTSLLGEMARAAGIDTAVGGNLGEPALDLLAPGVELYVLELSSFQLDTLSSLRPKAAVVLNLSADHLDRYPSLAAYGASKARVYRGASQIVVNADDEAVQAMAPAGASRRLFHLHSPQADDYGLGERQGKTWLCRGDEGLLAVDELLIPGRHNWANALAAWAMANALEIPDQTVRQVLLNFRGLRHRTQLVVEHQGVRWYNDSKGTNVGATLAALQGLVREGDPGRVVLIAGGDCKGAEFSQLAPVAEQSARAVILIGRDAPLLAAVLEGRVPLLRAKDMEQAVRLAAEQARPGDSVLLSPACASFDMFDNYMQRGDCFIRAVEGLLR